MPKRDEVFDLLKEAMPSMDTEQIYSLRAAIEMISRGDSEDEPADMMMDGEDEEPDAILAFGPPKKMGGRES